MPCSSTPPPESDDPQRLKAAWLTETVLALARGIAADAAFDRLPILADALEDAGCDNFSLLNHLRSDDPHLARCWALRRLLRTTLVLPGRVLMTFAYCPPGTFRMGSDNPDDFQTQQPAHTVTLTTGFYAGVYPVTQSQWRAVVGTSPSQFPGGTRPVEQVSWDEAQDFCRAASVVCGRPIRLPTEAEWEYACRAGTTDEWPSGFHAGLRVMTFNGQSFDGHVWDDDADDPLPRPAPTSTSNAGRFESNPWGLFDCHGNVWEWCEDVYDAAAYKDAPTVDPCRRDGPSSLRVVRGGSWRSPARACQSSSRGGWPADRREPDTGFRVVFSVG